MIIIIKKIKNAKLREKKHKSIVTNNPSTQSRNSRFKNIIQYNKTKQSIYTIVALEHTN